MSYTPAHKERTRARILESARRLLKDQGLAGVSVDGLMAEAGLTRGGFYAHFKSKDDLVAAALEDPVLVGFLTKHEGEREPAHWTRLVLEEYLGSLHRDRPGTGCPLAAFIGEASHAASEVQAAYAAQVKQAATTISARLPGKPKETEKEALGILALVIGGAALARAVDDKVLSDAILAACREAISDL